MTARDVERDPASKPKTKTNKKIKSGGSGDDSLKALVANLDLTSPHKVLEEKLKAQHCSTCLQETTLEKPRQRSAWATGNPVLT